MAQKWPGLSKQPPGANAHRNEQKRRRRALRGKGQRPRTTRQRVAQLVRRLERDEGPSPLAKVMHTGYGVYQVSLTKEWFDTVRSMKAKEACDGE